MWLSYRHDGEKGGIMTKTYRVIQGRSFEVKKVSGDMLNYMADRVIKGYQLLHDCYDRPSEAKRDIYNDWMTWAGNIYTMYSFGITSYNTSCFTLGGVIEKSDGKLEVLRITKAHNIVYVAKDEDIMA